MDIKQTSSKLGFRDYWSNVLSRLGISRDSRQVEPGLYALGDPTPDSPVFVSANYELSFNSLRQALPGIDGYILVLNTKGINVWCAAGKGTFGTDELVNRLETTGLKEVIRHRTLILPQLGAPGVAAHLVKKRSGFKVEYGPVRAADLPEYLKTRKADPEMRRVKFGLRDRLTLVPEAFRFVFPVLAVLAVIWSVKAGPAAENFLRAPGIALVLLSGLILFPILLPWIPTPDFSTKGFVLGGAVALLFALLKAFSFHPDVSFVRFTGEVVRDVFLWASPISYFALSFTGSTTFTSRSGVRREIFKYIPLMAALFGSGIILTLALGIFR